MTSKIVSRTKIRKENVMRDYAIITDSGCDLSQSMVEELDVGVAPMGFTIAQKAYRHFHDFREMSKKKFYELIRGGEIGKTNGANIQDIVDTGYDITEKEGIISLDANSEYNHTHSITVVE